MAALAGRVALVTGASRGIGRAIAMRLAEEGADVIVTYHRDTGRAGQVVAKIGALGRRSLALEIELTEPEHVANAFETVGTAFGRLDILVANAAATAFRPIAEQKTHNVERTFAISVGSFVEAVRASLPLMTTPSGRIVMVSGIDSHQAMSGHGVLGAAKAAAEGIVRSLALELGPRGITVNAVSPGFVDTDSSRLYAEHGLGRDFSSVASEIAGMTPLGRIGTPEDIAGLVAFLVSDAASFLTGQTIIIDGGLTMVSPLSHVKGVG